MSHERNPTRAVRPRRVLTLIAGASLIAAVAGCGDEDDAETLTKAAVIEQGSAICRQAERGVEELPPTPSGVPFLKATPEQQQRGREFLVGYAALLDSSREGLADLNAPEKDRELLDGYVEDIGRVADVLRAAGDAGPQKVEPQADEAFALFERASEQTAEYGFPKGVCGSGNSG